MARIRHPDLPGVIVDCSDRQARIHARSGWVDATPPPVVPLPADSEIDVLRGRAEGLGVRVDRRWGASRLAREIEAAEAAQDV